MISKERESLLYPCRNFHLYFPLLNRVSGFFFLNLIFASEVWHEKLSFSYHLKYVTV